MPLLDAFLRRQANWLRQRRSCADAPLEARCTTTGSATCRRRPGSTLMPVILFQRRN